MMCVFIIRVYFISFCFLLLSRDVGADDVGVALRIVVNIFVPVLFISVSFYLPLTLSLSPPFARSFFKCLYSVLFRNCAHGMQTKRICVHVLVQPLFFWIDFNTLVRMAV